MSFFNFRNKTHLLIRYSYNYLYNNDSKIDVTSRFKSIYYANSFIYANYRYLLLLHVIKTVST